MLRGQRQCFAWFDQVQGPGLRAKPPCRTASCRGRPEHRGARGVSGSLGLVVGLRFTGSPNGTQGRFERSEVSGGWSLRRSREAVLLLRRRTVRGLGVGSAGCPLGGDFWCRC